MGTQLFPSHWSLSLAARATPRLGRTYSHCPANRKVPEGELTCAIRQHEDSEAREREDRERIETFQGLVIHDYPGLQPQSPVSCQFPPSQMRLFRKVEGLIPNCKQPTHHVAPEWQRVCAVWCRGRQTVLVQWPVCSSANMKSFCGLRLPSWGHVSVASEGRLNFRADGRCIMKVIAFEVRFVKVVHADSFF